MKSRMHVIATAKLRKALLFKSLITLPSQLSNDWRVAYTKFKSRRERAKLMVCMFMMF